MGLDLRAARMHRPGQPVESFQERYDLPGEPERPGFRVPVARFLDD